MKKLKYSYSKVIQQNYGQGFEDVSEYVTNSQYIPIEMSNKLHISSSGKSKVQSLLLFDLKEYRLMGYSTRVVQRRVLN